MKEKILLWGRHGQDDSISGQIIPETVKNLYMTLGRMLFEEHVLPNEVHPRMSFFRHPNSELAKDTARAIAIGAFNIARIKGFSVPDSSEILDMYSFDSFNLNYDSLLNTPKNPVNPILFNSEGGPEKCMNFWLTNPYEKRYEGVEIMSYREVLSRVSAALNCYVNSLQKGKDLGVIVGHGLVSVEPAILTMVNSTRKNPVEKIEDIGGCADYGEFAKLRMNGSQESLLTYKGLNYRVNLNNIFR